MGIHCYGAMSCAKMRFIQWTEDDSAVLKCWGTLTCFNITSVATRTDNLIAHAIACRGSSACSHSSFVDPGDASNYMRCNGDSSCSFANILGYANVEGGGAYSLYMATIDSLDKDLNVQFHGYHSGVGATVYCQAGVTCNIECYGASCTNTTFDCNDNCNIKYIQPTFNETEFEYGSTQFDLLNERRCNNQINGTVFDIANEKLNSVEGIVSDSTMLQGMIVFQNISFSITQRFHSLKAYQSCAFTHIEQNKNVSNESLVISAHNGALGMSNPDVIIAHSPIYCSSDTACFIDMHANGNDVYCSGFGSCQGHIYGPRDVICSAYSSCWDSTIESDGHDMTIYGLAQNALLFASISCHIGDTCTIICNGFNACIATKVYCYGTCVIICGDDDLSACPELNDFSPTAVTMNPTPDPMISTTDQPTVDPTEYPLPPTYAPLNGDCGRFGPLPLNICTSQKRRINGELQYKSMNIICNRDGQYVFNQYDTWNCKGEPSLSDERLCTGSAIGGCVCDDRICDHALFTIKDDDDGCSENRDEVQEVAYVIDECLVDESDPVPFGYTIGCNQKKSQISFGPCGDWTQPPLNYTHIIEFGNFSLLALRLNDSQSVEYYDVCDLECVDWEKTKLAAEIVIGLSVVAAVGSSLLLAGMGYLVWKHKYKNSDGNTGTKVRSDSVGKYDAVNVVVIDDEDEEEAVEMNTQTR